MVPPRSDRISRVPPYSRIQRPSRVRGCHPLWPAFPDRSAYLRWTTGLFRFRSPLLAESLLMSVPPGTEMFQFPGFAPPAYLFSRRYPKGVGCPIRISTDQRLLAAPHGFSQRATSFIASWCQGIHRMPFSRSTLRVTAAPTKHARDPIMRRNHPRTIDHPKSRIVEPDALPRTLHSAHTHFYFSRHRRASHPPCRRTPVRPPTRHREECRRSLRGGATPPVGQKHDRVTMPLALAGETARTPGPCPERPARSGARRGAPEPDSRW